MMARLYRNKLILSFALILFILGVGVLGYRFIAGFDWVDALYMTIITVSTVGFSEVNPLDGGAKVFTVVLIICSVFILGYALSVITEYILGKNSLDKLKQKRMDAKIKELKDHIVVCGYGRNGMQAVEKLKMYKRPFVVVEQDEHLAAEQEEHFLVVKGNANDDEVLQAAGVDRAACLIVTMPDDADNLFTVLSSRQMNPELFIISRASKITSQKKLLLAGADKVVMPDKIGGDHMASLVVMPNLITFIDQLALGGGDTANLEEVDVSDFGDLPQNPTLRDLDLRKQTGCTVIGYVPPNGEYIINPEADLSLAPKSKLIVLGRPEQIRRLNQMFIKG